MKEALWFFPVGEASHWKLNNQVVYLSCKNASGFSCPLLNKLRELDELN